MKKYGDYFVTIGLEVHVALQTEEKLFSCSGNHFDLSHFSLLDAGVPGVMPVLSKEPVKMALAFALASHAEICKTSIFERKHYFYPDLPLGYQITQQHNPIMKGGRIYVSYPEPHWVDIEHAHLECDAAKSLHDKYNQYTAIDISRCASPLLEIVSMPCMHSPEEAKEYVKEIHSLVKFMGICDGKLEEGSFRVDASISLSKTEKLGTRVEIKNISSFSFLEDALNFEISRQTDMLDKKESIIMETRLFNEKDGQTYSMREKETVAEYRYMPDPDIPALVFGEDLIEEVREEFLTDYFMLRQNLNELIEGLTGKKEDASALLSSAMSPLWIALLKTPALQTERIVKMFMYWLPEVLIEKTLTVEQVLILDKSKLQAKEIKQAVEKHFQTGLELDKCLPQFMSLEDLTQVVSQVLSNFEVQKKKYLEGESKMLQFLIGKVMAEVKGRAPAQDVKNMVEKIVQM